MVQDTKPFGEENRRKLIERYFGERTAPAVGNAWEHVYRLLLWVDSSTALAHCYESDKCQPGRPWYARTLAFHDWLASRFGTTPAELGDQLDWLFQTALEEYLGWIGRKTEALRNHGKLQRDNYEGKLFPTPGSDPESSAIVMDALAPYFAEPPAEEAISSLCERLRTYWKQENKRKNLLGEGFEDVLKAVVEATGRAGTSIRTRTSIEHVEGFHSRGARDKATKVDLIVEHPQWDRPALVNVKWSIRADREDQLWDDFKEFVRFDRDQRGFNHYLVTNEFDPARLNAACDKIESNSPVFHKVVHISTEGIVAAYGKRDEAGPAKPGRRHTSWRRVKDNISRGRLISLDDWLAELAAL